jgi:mannose-P-dolichol utilization defect protein 1
MLFQIADRMGLPAECVKPLTSLQLPPSVCIKFILSKILGYSIIVGSSIIKVPQIINILKSRKVEGLNIYMFLLELIGYTISMFYSYRLNLPFSTYGENMFMTIQNLIILFLFFQFKLGFGFFFVAVTSAYSAFLFSLMQKNIVNDQMIDWLFSLTIPIFILGRIPQIYSNFKNKSTGQLSLITIFMQVGGSAARVFTTLQEVNDLLMLSGYLVALFLNGILLLQILWYWSKSGAAIVENKNKAARTTTDNKKTK